MTACFSLNDANARIPGLAVSASRLTQLIAHMRAVQRLFDALNAELESSTEPLLVESRMTGAQARLVVLAGLYHEEIRQLAAAGYEVHATDHVRLDWPARIGGRDLTLSWRLGEPSVTFCVGADGARWPVAKLFG